MSVLLVFVIANVIIFSSYLLIARYVVPNLNLRFISTKYGGAGFFLLCAATHIELTLHAFTQEPLDLTSWHMIIIHILQAIAVVVFTTSLYKEVGAAKGRLLNLSKNTNVVKNLISDIEYLQQEELIQENSVLVQEALANLKIVEDSLSGIVYGRHGNV